MTSCGHFRSAIVTGIAARMPSFLAGNDAAAMMLRRSPGSPDTTDGTSRMSCPPSMTIFTAVQLRKAEFTSIWKMTRGTAEYRCGMSLPRRGSVLLRFGGVSHTARVYWDGREVGCHYNAFTGFDILIPEAEAGAHTLTVAVDNRFSPESALHISNDYMTYGGITRPVEAHMVEGAYIQRTAFYARETGEGAFEVHARVWVYAMKGGS